MIDKKTYMTLEFDKVLSILSKYAVSTHTKEYIHDYSTLENIDDIMYELGNVNEASVILYELAESPNLFYDDISGEVELSEKHGVLSMAEIIKVAATLHNVRQVKTLIDSVNNEKVTSLHDVAEALFAYPAFEDDVQRCIISDTEMADNASEALRSIRREIKATESGIEKKLKSYITDSRYQKYLQDTLITIRNGRQVIPVKSECRSQIPGLIHDESQSKGTVYVEPYAIVELNNKLKSLYVDENNEIERILKNFTERVRLIGDNLRIDMDTMCYLDFVFAKAIYAHETDAIMPQVVEDGTFDIRNGRHPLLDSKKVVPISLYLDDKSNILVITGSNTGGKTVSLKLVGLLTLMTMSGMFVPCADGSKISIYDSIYSDIGDEQSIEESLSTFSSHITNMITITNNMTAKSLVLLDELGNGTDPIEGSALAIAIMKKILATHAHSIITTHFNEVKEFAFSGDGMLTASMDFDQETLKPTYRVLMGVVGSSNAIDIATTLGLDADIINDARAMISEEKLSFDEIINAAENARRKAEDVLDNIARKEAEIESKLLEVEREKADIERIRQRLNDNINREAKKLLASYMQEADEIVEELRDTLKKRDEASLFRARKLRSKLNNISYDEESSEDTREFVDTPIAVGDMVYIQKIDNVGEVVSINERKREYAIKAGIISMNVKFTEVKKVKKTARKKAGKVHYERRANDVNTDGAYEINVIGQNLMDATIEVDKFIDEAIMGGYKEVRVVHGKGKGILRNGLRAHFRTHPSIESYHEGAYGEGDAGVTILVLK